MFQSKESLANLRRVIFQFLLIFPALVQAQALNIPVVDPGHTDTGDTAITAFSAMPNVGTLKRIDLPQTTEASNQKWDAVVWIDPEPTLYKADSEAAWKSIATNKNHGLMVIGLPQDDPGVDS